MRGQNHVLMVVSMLALLAVPTTARSQNAANQCVPGGICCTAVAAGQTRCGTLDEFQRYAKTVCLRGDAIENKTTAQSIEVAGLCTAASIAAEKVAAAQKGNAQEHQRALDARHQLQQMELESHRYSAPASPPDVIDAARKEAVMVMNECRAKRLSGELNSYVESMQCSNPRIVQAFRRVNYPHMDLIKMMTSKRLEIAKKQDAGLISETEASAEGNQLLAQLAYIEQARRSGRNQPSLIDPD